MTPPRPGRRGPPVARSATRAGMSALRTRNPPMAREISAGKKKRPSRRQEDRHRPCPAWRRSACRLRSGRAVGPHGEGGQRHRQRRPRPRSAGRWPREDDRSCRRGSRPSPPRGRRWPGRRRPAGIGSPRSSAGAWQKSRQIAAMTAKANAIHTAMSPGRLLRDRALSRGQRSAGDPPAAAARRAGGGRRAAAQRPGPGHRAARTRSGRSPVDRDGGGAGDHGVLAAGGERLAAGAVAGRPTLLRLLALVRHGRQR